MAGPQRTDFSALYRVTLAPLRRYLARMLRDRSEAEDLAHDAYARVYRTMDTTAVREPEALLYVTARRLALNRIKRNQSGPISPAGTDNLVPFTPSTDPGVVHVVMARQEWAQLQEAITALPPGCRQVLLLSKMELRTHAEISAELGIAISTVEKQHARALRLLRAALGDGFAEHSVTTPKAGDRIAEGGRP